MSARLAPRGCGRGAARSSGRTRRRTLPLAGRAAVALLLAAPLPAQVLSVPWQTTDAGGAALAGSSYGLAGTVGQPDAGVPPAGGSYQVNGGFWPGATALAASLLFADGFEGGNTAAWSLTAPLARGLSAATADRPRPLAAPIPASKQTKAGTG